MPINMDEFLNKVAGDTMSSLIMGGIATSGHTRIGVCCGSGGICFCAAPGAIDIPFFSRDTLSISLPIASSTISADHEDFLEKASRRGWRAGDEVSDGFSDGFGGAF